jgi:hypothetical protein
VYPAVVTYTIERVIYTPSSNVLCQLFFFFSFFCLALFRNQKRECCHGMVRLARALTATLDVQSSFLP